MFVSALLLAASLQTTPSYDPQAQLTKALEIARTHSYRTDQIDWPVLEAKVRAAAEGADDVVDLLPAYVTLTQELGDNHSFIRPTQAISDGWRDRRGGPLVVPRSTPPLPPATSTFRGRRAVEARTTALPSGAGARVITVPRMFGGGDPAATYAADMVQAVLTDAATTCGYVIDLRGNVGGNLWPMATGLSPLLGDGPFGKTKDASGQIASTAEVRQGSAVLPSGQVLVSATGWRSEPALATRPVAVLLDDAVGSSGEAIAIAFQGRVHTRSFGQRTRGLATSNREFDLGDGVTLGIASAWMTDRGGRHYPDGVFPDQPVPHGDGDPVDPDDAVVEAAKIWLAAQPGCAPSDL